MGGKKMQRLKNKKGITLIALVITIMMKLRIFVLVIFKEEILWILLEDLMI